MKYFKKISILFFIIIVFTLLIIPTLQINKERISIEENRKLNSYKPIYDKKAKKINLNYGSDYENWFKDRFWGRNCLFRLNILIKYYIAGRFVKVNSVTIDKDDKIIYHTIKNNTYRTTTRLHIGKQIKEFDKYCKKRNIKFYMVVSPPKEIVYNPALRRTSNYDNAVAGINDIKKESGVDIIFPIDEYIKAKEYNPIYFKTDVHSTMDATYISYLLLMNAIKKDFPNVKISKSEDFNYYYSKKVMTEDDRKFHNGNSCKYGNLSPIICDKFLNIEYKYYRHKNHKDLIVNENNENKLKKKIYFYPDGSNLRVMIFGDSYSENFMDIFPYSFKNIKKIRLNNIQGFSEDEQYKILKNYETDIDEFEPDIIIVYVAYNASLYKLKDIVE